MNKTNKKEPFMRLRVDYLEKTAWIRTRTKGRVHIDEKISFAVKAWVHNVQTGACIGIKFEVWRNKGRTQKAGNVRKIGEGALSGPEVNIFELPPSVLRGISLNQALRYADRSNGNIGTSLSEIITHRIAETSRLEIRRSVPPTEQLLLIRLRCFGKIFSGGFDCKGKDPSILKD